MVRPVATSRGTPGSSTASSTARRSMPASSRGRARMRAARRRGATGWIRMRIPRYHNVLNPTKRVITVAPMPPEKRLRAGPLQPLARFHSRLASSGCAPTIRRSSWRASISSTATPPLPTWATRWCASKASPSWPPPKSRGAAVGRPGEVVALPGFFELRFHHAAGTGPAATPPLSGRRRGAAGGVRAGERGWPSTASRAPAAPRRHEARSLPAQSGGARLRRGALPAVLGRAHQRRPGDQHSHAGKADPAPEGVRVWRIARRGRRDRAGLRRRAGLPLGPRTRRANRWRPRWRATPRPTSTPPIRAHDLRRWAAQNLPPPRAPRAARGPGAAHRRWPPISWPRCCIR
jgi:hypothetical protein